MHMHPRARRQRIAVAGAAAAALLGVLVLVTGCGSSSNADRTSTTDPQRALAFAQCMRSNGVPDFPDPNAKGEFRAPAHEQQGNPGFQAAFAKCRNLAPGGEHEATGNPAFVDQVRLFAKCMRAHGLPNFPDPDASGRLRGIGHEQQDNPTYRAAFEVCRQKLPGGGQHGSGAGS